MRLRKTVALVIFNMANVHTRADSAQAIKTSTPLRKDNNLSANAFGCGISPISKNQGFLPESVGDFDNHDILRRMGANHSFRLIMGDGGELADEHTEYQNRSLLNKVQRLDRLLNADANASQHRASGRTVSQRADRLSESRLTLESFAGCTAKDEEVDERKHISLAAIDKFLPRKRMSSDNLPQLLSGRNVCNPPSYSIDSDDEEESDDENQQDVSGATEFDVKKLFMTAGRGQTSDTPNDIGSGDFVDTVTSRASRFGRKGALVYASKRSRLSARAVKILQSLSSQLEAKRAEKQSNVINLKAAASALSKAAQTDTVYSQKLHQHMSVFNEELYNQQSLSSEWQVVRKRCENSLSALGELQCILLQLMTFKNNFIEQHAAAGGGEQQQLFLDDDRMQSLVAALDETLESRNYIQSRVDTGHSPTPTLPVISDIDDMLAITTSTVMRYFRSALSDSEIKPVLLLDAVETDLKSELEVASAPGIDGGVVVQDEAAMQQELLAKSRPTELIDYSQSTYRMLRQASSWLQKAHAYSFGRSFDHISLYYQIRSQVMTRSLQDFIRYVRDERSRQFFFAKLSTSGAGAAASRAVTQSMRHNNNRLGGGGGMMSTPSESNLASSLDAPFGSAASNIGRSTSSKTATLLRSKFRGSERSGTTSSSTTTTSGFPGQQGVSVGGMSNRAVPAGNRSIATMPYEEAVHELDAFLLSAKAYLKLLQVELLLCNDLIEPEARSEVFERIIAVPMSALLAEHARRVVKQVSALHDGVDSQSLLLVLQTLHHIDCLTTSYQQLLVGSSQITYTKWIDIVSMFEASGLTSIDLFVDKLRKMDSTTSAAPADGAVHELTIRTVSLLNGLNLWKDQCSRLLSNRAGPTAVMSPHQSEKSGGKAVVPVFSNFLATMLASVNSTVITRSHLYNDPFLAAIFRLNNHHYILRALRSGTLVREIERAEPKIEDIFEAQIMQAEDDYKKCWTPLMMAMHDLLSHPVTNKPLRTSYDEHKVELNAKDRDMMKQRCVTIKKELDDLYKRQVKYKISDQTLRDVMIDNLMSMVLTQFKVFYENYKLVEFSSNKHKYMPCTPQHVETMIKQFFSGESYDFVAQ